MFQLSVNLHIVGLPLKLVGILFPCLERWKEGNFHCLWSVGEWSVGAEWGISKQNMGEGSGPRNGQLRLPASIWGRRTKVISLSSFSPFRSRTELSRWTAQYRKGISRVGLRVKQGPCCKWRLSAGPAVGKDRSDRLPVALKVLLSAWGTGGSTLTLFSVLQ